MSTVKVNTLTGTSTAGSIAVTGEGNSTTTNLQQGLAKHFHYYDHANTTVKSSLNQSSITDVNTGFYDPQLTNNMASVNYNIFAHATAESNNANFTYYGYNRATGSYRRYNYDNASRDMERTDGMLFGDLA